MNDAYYWLQTFTKSVNYFETGKEKKDALAGLNILVRLNFLALKFGVFWSHVENDAMIFAQNPQFEGIYVKSWDFPFGSLFSHGGRVNLVLDNNFNFESDWMMKELTKKSYIDQDNNDYL